ncbi:hypothetical protein [Bosea sp. (in: a-proteobacteria)]|nr:hypothetical protein [Bosea sp. (in: a-proteobacteria)]MBN9437011.1 hypothetical protein [Bosea sp. (in: a-proteobacteria)]
MEAMANARLMPLDEPAAGTNRVLLRKIENKIAYEPHSFIFTQTRQG